MTSRDIYQSVEAMFTAQDSAGGHVVGDIEDSHCDRSMAQV